MKNYQMYINGTWLDANSGARVEVINPSTEEVIATVANGDESDAELAMSAAVAAQKQWRKLPARKRAEKLLDLVAEIKAHRDELAKLLVTEQGKLLKVARMEVDVTCSFIEYACEWARHIEGDIVESDNPDEHIWIHKVPRGVVVAITAWNFPLALAGRKIGPALVAGNAIIVKPTTETPLATLELAKLADKAGLPKGLLNVVTGPGRTLGDALVRHPNTSMISMTGSTPAGQAIVRAASDNLAHVQLELGGKAPFIVLEDANIDAAVDAALGSRFDNCGQVCTCNERLYVHHAIYDQFMEKFVAKVKAIKVGDPMHEDSDMGPKVSAKELANMEAMTAKALEEGATLACGGKRLTGPGFEKGYWFEPTVFTNVTQDMSLVHEEIFGPILPVVKFNDFDQVVAYANDSEYGLSAMIFTNKIKLVMDLVNDLECGEIYVNRGHGEQHQGFHNGYKLSGSGGEDGKYGFEQYLEKKTFYVDFSK
ncbi:MULTISPECIES: aldehyde dehydrogenase [unclassified Agarivorans]|uniref:aldehyde dehydrogenase n=1 Tax=unclassified Agarivorans TaxID=2636026 RepID=UPI0026E330A7|nr:MULTISPECIES: aldehyde dehydrogenase [unclassified Agarivorans]MDO6685354.1 aldehyde dehydrogenase [Agarivorans sp. 3_MG-2023]MDO6715474.1 aldehyde dehydrogenase [Agarivorans sp. 2_MG-2023]